MFAVETGLLKVHVGEIVGGSARLNVFRSASVA